jgi:hypothetical protein
MRVTSKLFQSLYLAPRQLLLSARSVKVVYELFTMLDVVGEVRELHTAQPSRRAANVGASQGTIDDLAFVAFILATTDMSETEAYKVFDIFDVDSNGSIEFDEFYLIACILIAIKVSAASRRRSVVQC